MRIWGYIQHVPGFLIITLFSQSIEHHWPKFNSKMAIVNLNWCLEIYKEIFTGPSVYCREIYVLPRVRQSTCTIELNSQTQQVKFALSSFKV